MKILLCDWNETLVDDTEIWERAMQKTFLAFGKKPATIAEYFEAIEKGDYLEAYRSRGISEAREKLNEIYEAEYERLFHEIDLFPEAKKTLMLIRSRGVCLMLITAHKEFLTVPLLEKFGLDSLFDYCSFHCWDKKSEITRIIRKKGARKRDCYYIGDSPSDMRHAKKSGIGSIAFLSGYAPEYLMRKVSADYYVRYWRKIPALIR